MSAEIAALDDALALAGEDAILRRVVTRSNVKVNSDVTCRAAVRGVSAEQIMGTIAATDLNVILSPTQITAAAWPGQDDSTPGGSTVNQALPRITDFVVVQGKPRQVKVSKPIYVGGVWCRTDLVVAG